MADERKLNGSPLNKEDYYINLLKTVNMKECLDNITVLASSCSR